MVLKNFSKFAIKKAVLFFMAIMVVSLVLVGCDKKVKVESVTVSKQTISLDLGQEETVKATVLPENATDKTVTWSSSDTSVATVSNGKIVAVGSGTATITATAGEKTATVSVTVKAIKYTFSFTVNGGSPVAAQEVESGKKATKPTDPERQGHSFGGWYNDAKFITPYNFDTPITDDVVVYAKWIAHKFVVKFDVDGGVAIPDLQIEYNNSVTKPANPVKEGYTFINWFKDAEKTDSFDFATEKITQAITIYAKFEINKYTVKFNTNGGSSIADQIIEHGQKVTKPVDPTKEGFLFKGWFVNDLEFNFDNVVTSAVTVVAKWEEDPNFKLITFNMNGGSWNINSIAKFLSGSPVKTTPLAGQYNVTNATYLEVYKTSIFINDSKKQFTPSKWVTRVVVALNAKGFYEVSKVLAAGTDATEADLAGAYVLFAHEDYKVGEPFLKGLTVGQIVSFTGFDITTAAIGAVEGSLNIYEAAQGVSATQALVATGAGLPVPSKANHKFVGWYTTADFSGDPVTAVSATATVYAKFDADLVDVKFDSKGGSEVETGKVLYNQKLNKPADPTKIGYTFVGWFTDAELTKEYDFNTLVTSTFTLYAKWEAVLQDVTYVTNGAAEIAAQQVPFDGKITKPAEPTKEGFVFLGWFTEAEFTNLYDFNALVKGPVTLHAKWAAKKDIVVDYTAMYNETLKAYYIKIEVSGEVLDVASIKAISQVRLAGDFVVAVELTPDTDTALWFKVAAENANPNLKKAGLYTYVITKQDDSVYAIEFDYKPESVTDLPFEVIFSMNGGDAVASQIIKKDEKATQPADPTYKGYTFKGWFADSKLETEFDFNTPITGITTVYAKWEIIEYTITYTTNGGTIRYKNVNEMLVDFLKDFHTFVQSTDSLEVFMHGEGKTSGFAGTWANEATKAKIFEGPRPTEVNNAFFASSEAYMEKWLPFFDLIQKYVVAVNPAQNFWGDTYVGLIRLGNFIQNTRPAYQNWAPQGWVGPEKFVVTSDTFEMPIPTKANYDFVGWYTTADFKGEVVTKVEKGSTGNLVLYAKYIAR